SNGPGLTVPTSGLALGDHVVQVIVSGQCSGVARTVTNTTTLSVEAAPPNLTCSAVPGASSDGNCQAAVPDVRSEVSVSEGCSAANAITLSQSPAAGALVGLGAHTITVTATDAAGNSATCTTVFTVTDTTAPTVNCSPVPNASTDSNCQATVPNVLSGVTASD